jgi:hypothetical protein
VRHRIAARQTTISTDYCCIVTIPVHPSTQIPISLDVGFILKGPVVIRQPASGA